MIKKLSKILEGEEIKKYFFNTSWMMGEKILTMGLTMVVSVFVARYLGPEQYGILSYAISLSSLFAVATHMGLSGLAVRELVNNPRAHGEVMGTIFGLKFAGGLIAMIAFLTFIFTANDVNNMDFWALLIVSGVILLKPFEVFDFWFQSQVKAKYSSIVRAVSIIFISVIKLSLVAFGAHLLTFAAAYLLQALLIASLFTLFFSNVANSPIKNWRFILLRAKKVFSQGWMIMLGSIFAMIYLKIDQVMIKWLVSSEEVGIYSVATKISEAWYFIPGVIVGSVFPKLLELRKNNEVQFKKRLQQLFDYLFVMALILAIIVTLVSEPVMNVLYGVEFKNAAVILSIHIWAGLFIFMRAVFSKWILVENGIAFSMITHGSGALINILLNIILIPTYAGVGAAIATIISYAMASYLSLFFYNKTRPIFWMMTRSFAFPIRYLM